MKTKTTYENLFNFAFAAQSWLAGGKDRDKTKLGYAITRMMPRVQKLQGKYNNGVEDINIDCCATDDKGIILRDEGGNYKFTKDGLKERNKRRESLFESEIEIEPYFATDVPADLTDLEREAFYGFIIREEATAAEA